MRAVSEEDLPSFSIDYASTNGPWLVYTCRRNATAGDVSYRYFENEDLCNAPWMSVFINELNVFEQTVDPDPDGDGSATLVSIRMKAPPDEAVKFLMFDVDI